ncbi:hypothetical protein ACH5RR_016983 [Cinchona calisaya]|uniref:Uncharacterized protein n=1 Tax=Cinchona calisaya TaxID=153742 RepID=A0ABD2ZYL6_9GENT
MKETDEAYLLERSLVGVKNVGNIEGLNVGNILDELKAAAIAYGLDEKGVKKNTLAIHFGGGTLMMVQQLLKDYFDRKDLKKGLNPDEIVGHYSLWRDLEWGDHRGIKERNEVRSIQDCEQGGKPYIEVKIRNGEIKVFSPEEIGAMVITKMKESTEAYLGKKTKAVVVTVPAYFNDTQKQGIKNPCNVSGLNVARILEEPKAVASAYVLDEKDVKKIILIFHLGGGTFDVSILTIDDGHCFDILAISGDNHLGGNDFDQRVMEYFIELIKKKHGKDISEDGATLGKLRRECERGKKALSSQDEFRVEILCSDSKGSATSQVLFDGKEFKKRLNPDEAVAFGVTVHGGLFSLTLVN